MKMHKNLVCLTFAILGLGWSAALANDAVRRVTDMDGFRRAVSAAAPGDTIVLANGTWRDARLVFEAKGTAEKPIVLRAETPGKVTLEGASMLRLAGEYLVVSGLVFVNGYTPGSAVIEYRAGRNKVANHSRVTNCVIDNYNPPDRFKRDSWVLMYGKHNRFDHNYLAGKKNSGVTVVVRLNAPEHQENHHRIDHNHFGYRPRLGSNGGETLRVGVSTYSLTSSHTVIEDNLFEKCNGETEVASIKASETIVRRNTFFECEGSLVMRHGNNNLFEGNWFIGNGKPETGGIRVINAGQKVVNNYFQGLTGERFRAALAVMNGVPNSLLNRYHKVKDAVIAYNTFVDSDHIQLGVGSDFERTDVPENTLIAYNIFDNARLSFPYEALDNISGVRFEGNLARVGNPNFDSPGFARLDEGLTQASDGVFVAAENTLKSHAHSGIAWVEADITGKQREAKKSPGAVDAANLRAKRLRPTAETTGVSWYDRTIPVAPAFGTGKVHAVSAKPGALAEAFAAAAAGDIIELTEAATYALTRTLTVTKTLTIRASAGLERKPLLEYHGNSRPFSFLAIEDGGRLKLQGLAFDGAADGYTVAESAIRTSKEPMIEHYDLFVDGCDFMDFQESRFNAFRAYQSTFADTIEFVNCRFSKISGDAISMAAEKEDRGKYQAEFVNILNCVFDNVMGAALDLYRGGNDESTFGPFLTVDHSVFNYVNNKEQGSVLRLVGVQNAHVRNSIFVASGRGGRSVKFEESRWNMCRVNHSNIYQSGGVESYYDNVRGDAMYAFDPLFRDAAAGDFRLERGSPLHGRASDGRAIGCLYENGKLRYEQGS